MQFSDTGTLRRAKSPLWTKLRHSLIVLKVLGLGCLVTAMARPQAGREIRELSAEGIDIMLTLDVSSSMEIDDLGPFLAIHVVGPRTINIHHFVRYQSLMR